ncbi:MAG: glycosyltransferase [Lentisphaerae bacterium]|nr:glycosyltransferase [Lentisphaerota bacterium]
MTDPATPGPPSSFPREWRDLDVSLCHDWLTGMRGGERVLEILCEAFPNAPVFTLIHSAGAVSKTINSHPVHTSWLQSVPGIFSQYRRLLPLFPHAVRQLALPGSDLVISTNHCVAKAVRVPAGARHLCYCFTPMRYAWTFYREYFGTNPLKALAAKPVLAALRRWDRKTADSVDLFVAISEHVRKRIRRAYGRDSVIVYPPVDLQRLTPGETSSGDYDLIVSALVPYKRVDLAVEAYRHIPFPLKIVGQGSDSKRLRAHAPPNVTFLGWQDDASVLQLYRNCRLLVFPGEEDFGIVPLEAQACGKPVVAFRKGGALETVADGVSGVFFKEQTERDLTEAVLRCAGSTWEPDAIRAQAARFGRERFVSGMANAIRQCLEDA